MFTFIPLFFQKINTLVLNTLFPIHCLSCQKEGEWVCSRCFKDIPLLEFQVCPKCERFTTSGGTLCPNCKGSVPLDALIASTRYKEHCVKKIIHVYKYKLARDIAPLLGLIMAKAYIAHTLPLPDVIIPVPLHSRRQRWRGFNQSTLLALHLESNLTAGLPIPIRSDVLLRTRYTCPQMKIKNYSARKENIVNAFTVRSKKIITGKKILLIDDIATTGATLFECARVLKQNGAGKVYAIVTARQEIKNF